jgi:arabinose-5-phosphate isomerase
MIAYDLPVVSKDDSLIDVIHQITSGKLGLALTFSTNDGYSIITDGDLRRATEKYGRKIFDLTAKDLLVKDPITITPDTNIQVAYDLMNKNRITSLIVVDEEKVVGILKMQ